MNRTPRRAIACRPVRSSEPDAGAGIREWAPGLHRSHPETRLPPRTGVEASCGHPKRKRVALQPVAETIRDYFKHRTRHALKIMGVGVAVAAMGIALFGFGYLLAGGVGAVIGVVIVCGGLWYLELTRCPRCLARLSATASSARLPRPINFCPYCGANLDSDRPSTAG